MQTIILCGGLGTRLREETEFRPKPMVNIGIRPILWHIMQIYAHYGYNEFILALGYKGEMVKDYFCHYELMNNDVTIELGKPDRIEIHNNPVELGWKITLADTGMASLKGSRLKQIEKYVTDDTIMVTYGDGLSDINLDTLLKFHQSHGKIATVSGIMPTSRFGELKIEDDQVLSFREKPEKRGKGLINGGFFIFNREFFNYLSADENCDLEYGPLEDLARDGELMVYKHFGFWACMDTFRDMEFLNNLWNENKAPWKVW
ncbi:glucose-1-phosphate cytidylyltransferase [Thermodesulfobacteriota bacterium]